MGFSKVEATGDPWLKKADVLNGVNHIQVLEVPEEVETEFEGKKSMKIRIVCKTNKADKPRVKWDINSTTRNFLIDLWGSEPSNWLGKELDIVVKQAGSSQPGVYPKDCNLEKVLS